MIALLTANAGTIFITFALFCVVTLIIVKISKDKKHGKSFCGCNCGHCPMNGSCHNGK